MGMMSTGTCLLFVGPGKVELVNEPIPIPRADEVLVRTRVSGISAGTEMLVFRNQFPSGISVDATLDGYGAAFTYPLKYGYASVGEVVDRGADVDPAWVGRRIFAFQPHRSHYAASPESLIPVPHELGDDQAVFLANMETAVTLVLDGSPRIGERVAVFGQGIVGLLTTGILARFPLAELCAIDRHENRLERAREMGASRVMRSEVETDTDPAGPSGFDLSFEVSGHESGLQAAIDSAAFSGRIVVGSWFGSKDTALRLGAGFHRNRLQLISSQVSTVSPELSGRWTKARRLETAWRMIQRLNPATLITHRYSPEQAQEAYQQLAEKPETTLQVIIVWD